MRRDRALAACLVLLSCEAPPSPPPSRPAQSGPLGGDVVARVGDVVVTKDQVARIAAAQGVSPTVARDLAVRDALFSAEARARQLSSDRGLELAAGSILARALLKDVSARAEARGPVTDAELDLVTARNWVDLDRPDAAISVHAVVMLKADADADLRARASALATTIRKAVSPAVDLALATAAPNDPNVEIDPVIEAFRRAVDAVPKEGLEVRSERLPPVAPDGRIVGQPGMLEESFARAANALPRRGDLSAIVSSSYGLHVILLLDRVPGFTMPREERRARVRDEVMSSRARADKEKLLDGLRAGVAVNRDVDALLAVAPVDR